MSSVLNAFPFLKQTEDELSSIFKASNIELGPSPEKRVKTIRYLPKIIGYIPVERQP
jgi:hypothetical protein